ncbi:BREX system P-loop protein BrxC [Desulfallas sp. Bu1-1]|uniref:BREX system P-loop protein BrxC n=1 Tax=Desulfallas sp. Bu1-1 TaxID=2787620 RepID=UPI00189E0BA5|nr:BREX system P-loop protein BrxC [Desulfallas sp. Bu1-1]MBF7082781.1 BREX system P-loop protein BrxC [Desulfallas sp. Bu1-1]
MQVGKMFEKNIFRDIKGVIKIGQNDEDNIHQELEEYVVTRELTRHFSDFFEAYKKSIHDYTDKMGVWISGFFGSGKSHFLKILSYLLDNPEVKGKKAVEYFNEKIADPVVLADINTAAGVSSDVILFNIDSKSDSDSKVYKDAIVKVFMKVFNEKLGFCGSMPWVAELERQLCKDGTYQAFKDKFQELSGNTWEEAREDFYFEEDNIVQALAATTRMSEEAARNWYLKAEENYTLSIEKFARLVKEYIESRGNNHHVVFLVDEMGQYIGDNTKLMLNLQTLVEDLGTQCGGKAWVIVTSQQDIDSITKVKGNDFSKIQGRFSTRLSLSSANVDEVIKKRILLKNQVARDTLKLLYEEKSAILKNLFTFSADTAEMKTYRDAEEFVQVYPFVPYQFKLLQSVFTAIRLHGASGKHLAEGERSLLSAFQEAAMQYADRETGTLVPFSAFYKPIESFLDHNISTVIIQAGDNDRLVEEDVEILQLLFMIKYVKEMPANLENLATLMVSHIDDDKVELKKRIEASLKRLLKETLIQKNGNEYDFLTHAEQDVNREIKNIPVDMGEVILKVGEIIFEQIYQDKKYRYSARYNFGFNQIIDDRPRGNQNNEIGIKIITPYYATGPDISEQALRLMSARDNHLIVKLPADTSFLEEMEEVIRIETFLQQKSGASLTPEWEEIKARKYREVSERKKRVQELLNDALAEAEVYVNMQKLDIKEKNPVLKINTGFKALIESIYTKLDYIVDFVESPKELNDILAGGGLQITLTGDKPNQLALDEIHSHIERNTQRNIPVTMKGLIDMYTRAPYGWKDLDVAGCVAELFKAGEIKLQMGHEYLGPDDQDLVKYLTKRDYTDRLLVKKRIKTPPHLIQNARKLAKELFSHIASSDEDGLMKKIQDKVRDELAEIQRLLVHYERENYPGRDVLENGQRLLSAIVKIKDTRDFYEQLNQYKDDLLNYADYVTDVKKFFNNQREHFDNALEKLRIYEKNKSYVLDTETIKVVEAIEKIVKAQEPYSQIHKLPSLVQEFEERFAMLLEIECRPVRQVIERDYRKVKDELVQYAFKDELGPKFRASFEELKNRLDRANNFFEAIAMKEESDRLKMRCLQEITEKKAREQATGLPGNGERAGREHVVEEKEKYRHKRTVHVSVTNILHGASTIETREDIDKVLQLIRGKLESELKEDIIIKLV